NRDRRRSTAARSAAGLPWPWCETRTAAKARQSTSRTLPRAAKKGRAEPQEAAMIPRYTRPEMAAIWAPEHRLRLWLEIELAALDAMAAIGDVPSEAAAKVRTAAAKQGEALIDPQRIEQIEAETRHDVIAFLTHIEQVIGPEARYLHLGMTSSDLLDTALALQLRAAADLLLADLDR